MSPQTRTPKGSAKRYDQYCPVARALDVLGERWTLLVVRNLLMGPRRYTDLRDALPGIATDLLTARLRTLEEAGYVERRKLPRPAPVTVYELTEAGRRLGYVVLELARVGIEHLGPPAPEQPIDPGTLVLSLRASFRPGSDGDAEGAYNLEIDGEPFTATVRDGQADTGRGQIDDPRCTIATSARTLAQLLSGAADPREAMAAGDLRLQGPQSSLTEFLSSFAYPSQ